MNIHFQYQQFVVAFAAIPVLILVFLTLLRWKKKTIKRIGDEKLVNALIDDYSPQRFRLKFILLLVAIIFGILALMNPRKPGSSENISRKGIDVVIALDVSKSMLAADMQPSRLDNAKTVINRLIDAMADDRIGLVLFAGKAYLQMPLTTDHESAKMFVSTASPGSVPQQGTAISDALKMSSNVFTTNDERFKTVILISDGEDHESNEEQTAKNLADEGIMINTIGIGSAEGSTIIDPATGQTKTDESGNVVVSKLNEDELKNIAEATNGVYDHLQNAEATTNVLLNHLSGIEKKAFADSAFLDYTTFYMYLAAAMFILLTIENFIPERKKVLA